jgi:transposase
VRKKLSEEEKELFDKLHTKGLSVAYISNITNRSYSAVYNTIRELNDNYSDVNPKLKQKNFKSIYDYQKENAKKRQEKPINKRCSNLILERLLAIDK